MGPIGHGGRGVGASSTPSQEASGDQQPESGAQPARADEPAREAETPPDSTEADEIIDLMLYSEPQSGGVDESGIDAVLQPATEPVPIEPQPVPPGEESQLPRYIFLNGEWIEVEPGVRPETPPAPPPRGDEPVPAIDWDAIADADEGSRIIRIPVGELRRGDMRYNIVIRAGDVIRLESGDFGFYYVTGHVRRPGVFRFTTGAKITLKSAIATAAGLDALGWPERVTVYRRVGDREQMIQVNLDRIYAGLEPDFYLKADDIINIGSHPIAPFLLSLRNLTIPQTASVFQLIYRFTHTETEFRNRNLDAPGQFPGLFP
ncbi:MAG: SLBB domain-containing protein [Planctomycetes bacterium]|nr:SLBB domain-containing protein [Planctomycetota bacterium]